MRPTRLWLIGLMASGKTTIGREVARRWDCGYLDNDEAVGQLAGRSTVEMSHAGGTLLHDWESRYAHSLGDRPPPLVAGVPASCADRPDDLAALAASGRLVYLRCDVATLAMRVRHDPPRPWFTGDPEALLQRMFDSRDEVLRAACEVVDGTGSPADVTAAVLALPEQDGHGRRG